MNKTEKTNLQWLIINFAIVFIIIAYRSKNILFSSYIYAEDGAVFLPRALEFGWRAIFMPYAGYLHVIPETLTVLAVIISKIFTGSIGLVPIILRIFSLCIAAVSVSYIQAEKFSSIMPDRLCRMLTSIVLAAIGGGESAEIFHTITNIQWWLGIVVLLNALILFFCGDIKDTKLELVLMFLIGLSTPLGIVGAIVYTGICMWHFIKNTLLKEQIFKTLIIDIPVIIQYILILLSGTRNGGNSLLHTAYLSLKTFTISIPSILYISLLQSSRNNIILLTIIGCVLWMLTAFILKQRKIFFFLCCCCYFLIFLSYFSAYHTDMIWEPLNGGRYLALPQFAFLILIACLACQFLYSKQNIRLGMVVAIIAISIGNHYIQERNIYYSDVYKDANFLYDEAGSNWLNIRIDPEPWSFRCKMVELDTAITDKSGLADTMNYYIDTVNGMNFNDGITIQDIEASEYITFNGWATDVENHKNPATVLVRCGSEYYAALMKDSLGIDEFFGGNGYYDKAYFEIKIPTNVLKENGYSYDLYIISGNKDAYFKITDSFKNN